MPALQHDHFLGQRLASVTMTRGRRIGVYEIVAPIGAGGMGEVYRAKNTRLRRDVAINILPRAFNTDPDRLARFEREARVLASLNHPNIATIHGVEEGDGIKALVLELVPGDTLAGPILGACCPSEWSWGEAAHLTENHSVDLQPQFLRPRSTVCTALYVAGDAFAPGNSVSSILPPDVSEKSGSACVRDVNANAR
jgi:hypothetical protein